MNRVNRATGLPTPPSLTVAEYAGLTGLSPQVVREQLRRGNLAARIVKGPHGFQYQIEHPNFPSETPQASQTRLDSGESNGQLIANPLAKHLEELSQVTERQQRLIAELETRCRWLQGQLRTGWAQIQELEALADRSPLAGASIEATYRELIPVNREPDSIPTIGSEGSDCVVWWRRWFGPGRLLK